LKLRISVANAYEFNQRTGYGSVPDNANVDYKGFVIWVKPLAFLSCVEQPPVGDLAGVREGMKAAGVGSPFLVLKPTDAGYKVVGHEGRHRCLVLQQDQPNTLIPVHVFVNGMRARDWTPATVRDLLAAVIPENHQSAIPIPAQQIVLGGVSTKLVW